jgi:leucyl aminopeptidase
MEFAMASASPVDVEADVIIVACSEGTGLNTAAKEFDRSLGGVMQRLIENREITGAKNEVISIPLPAGRRQFLCVLIGTGPRASLDRGTVYRAAATAAKSCSAKPRQTVACYMADDWTQVLEEAAIAGLIAGSQGHDLYRAKRSRTPFSKVLWSGRHETTLRTGAVIGESINLARKLVNEPPNEIYPETFARIAQQVARDDGVECEVWDEQRLIQERCGSLLAVGRASRKSPRLVLLTHRGGREDEAPLALVGKGVTFDSGGLSIKPTDGMKTMKCDMAGAATVLATISAIARLELPINVIGAVGLVENMLGGDAFRVGDVLKARSGKTIEVLNTDAEGRLVLADVLDVVADRKPSRIVDLATLTGACCVALGLDVAGVMSNEDSWCHTILTNARTVGEPAWQLPMFPEYSDQIRSDIADIKNTGDGRWGGAITAAKFLEEFVRDIPWVHVDIAGPAYNESPKPWLETGGTGVFIRTLIEVARNWPPK